MRFFSFALLSTLAACCKAGKFIGCGDTAKLLDACTSEANCAKCIEAYTPVTPGDLPATCYEYLTIIYDDFERDTTECKVYSDTLFATVVRCDAKIRTGNAQCLRSQPVDTPKPTTEKPKPPPPAETPEPVDTPEPTPPPPPPPAQTTPPVETLPPTDPVPLPTVLPVPTRRPRPVFTRRPTAAPTPMPTPTPPPTPEPTEASSASVTGAVSASASAMAAVMVAAAFL